MKHLLTLLLAAASLALVGCGGPSPGDAVKDLAYAMEAGDAEKMKELIPALEENLGDSKIETMAKQMKKNIEEEGGLESVTIDEEKISEDGKTATVTATMKSKDGEADTDEFELVKVDGKWVIDLGEEANKMRGGAGIPLNATPAFVSSNS